MSHDGFVWVDDQRPQVQALMREGAAQGLGDAAEFLREEADRTVPIEEDILAGSGGVDVDPAALEASAYYDTPYAVRQHEDTRLRHDQGRRAKWLEATASEQAPAIGERIAASVRRALGGS